MNSGASVWRDRGEAWQTSKELRRVTSDGTCWNHVHACWPAWAPSRLQLVDCTQTHHPIDTRQVAHKRTCVCTNQSSMVAQRRIAQLGCTQTPVHQPIRLQAHRRTCPPNQVAHKRMCINQSGCTQTQQIRLHTQTHKPPGCTDPQKLVAPQELCEACVR